MKNFSEEIQQFIRQNIKSVDHLKILLFFNENNVILFIDKVIIPSVTISPWRTSVPLVGIIFLLYGLVWEEK